MTAEVKRLAPAMQVFLQVRFITITEAIKWARHIMVFLEQITMITKVIKLDQHTQVGSETKRQNSRNSIYGSGAALLAVGEIPTPPTKLIFTQYMGMYI